MKGREERERISANFLFTEEMIHAIRKTERVDAAKEMIGSANRGAINLQRKLWTVKAFAGIPVE
jgi:hypothetical protein